MKIKKQKAQKNVIKQKLKFRYCKYFLEANQFEKEIN